METDLQERSITQATVKMSKLPAYVKYLPRYEPIFAMKWSYLVGKQIPYDTLNRDILSAFYQVYENVPRLTSTELSTPKE